MKTTLHRDGTVTFWSVYEQRWVRTRHIDDYELAAMAHNVRPRVIKHLERRREQV